MISCARPVNLSGPEQRVKRSPSIVTSDWAPVKPIRYEKVTGFVSGKLPHVRVTFSDIALITVLYEIVMFAVDRLYTPLLNPNSTQSEVVTFRGVESMLFSVVHVSTALLLSLDHTHVEFEEIWILSEQLVCVNTVVNRQCRSRVGTRR